MTKIKNKYLKNLYKNSNGQAASHIAHVTGMPFSLTETPKCGSDLTQEK
jgi:hypothetical protein